MLDSTARAERLDLSSSEAAFYTWEVAQKPVAVRVPLALMDRLEHETVETFRSLSSRGSEIGGLLLGAMAPGTPAIVTLTDYELIACDYSRGPLYRLSDADTGRIEQAMQKYTGGSSPRVVGYFRSHTRKGLLLDAEDISFFESRFTEPQHVVLLIRPFATKASTAGIFLRENGRIGEVSPLEFPFRSSELSSTRIGEKTEPAAPAPAASATPAAPKPQPRAQIVPIASRREVALPDPAPASAQPAEPPVPAAAAAERVETPEPPSLKSVTAAPKFDFEKIAGSAKPAPEVKDAPAVEPEAEVVPEASRKNKKLRLTVAAAIGMLVLVGGTLVVIPSVRNRFMPRPPAAQQDSSPLSLRLERTTGGMLLTWNRDLPVIQKAGKVMLSISDGDRHENIQLNPDQVRTGSILYTPITGDVSFQMEVTDGHSKTTSESLRVLDPRPSPLADPSDAQAAKQTTPAKPSATATTTPAPTDAAAIEESKSQQEEAPSSRPSTPLRAFNTQSLAQRLRPVNPTDLPEAPAEVRANNTTSGSLAGIMPSQTIAPPAPKAPGTTTPPASGTTANTAAQSAPGVGGRLVPAVVVTRVDPEYPRLARQAGASGIVELEATIGVDGKVKNPRVIRGNTMLQKPAVDAVMQWRYKPAMLNGAPVESPVEIRLNFVSAR